MILRSNTIREFLSDPSDLSEISLVGVDLTLKEIRRVEPFGYSQGIYKKGTVLDVEAYKSVSSSTHNGMTVFLLPPGVYSVIFDQGIDIPLDCQCFIEQRSSLSRLGGSISHSLYEPGFKVDNLGAMMKLDLPVVLEQHCRIAQITGERLGFECKRYDGQWQGINDFK